MGSSFRLFACSALVLFTVVTLQARDAQAATVTRVNSNCFPFGTAKLSGTKAPHQSRDDWWCPSDLQYGFMGCDSFMMRQWYTWIDHMSTSYRFSYPLEKDNCSDVSNSFAKINDDFKRMKSQFGATMVRIYAPQCRDESIWRNLLNAGIANNM